MTFSTRQFLDNMLTWENTKCTHARKTDRQQVLLYISNTHMHTPAAIANAWARQLSKPIFLNLTFDISVDITGVIASTDLWEKWESVFTLACLTRPQIQKVTKLPSFAELL